MANRKTVDDLDDDPGSVGGAMSQWPRRTLAWLCRDERVRAADAAVATALLDREVRDLTALAGKAEDVGIDPSGLEAKRDALEAADADEVLAALRQEYRGEYDDAGAYGTGGGCPFEESGLDKACWRCPVPGAALDALESDPPGPEADP